MTLQAAIEASLPRLRAEALARMTSTATVRRRNGYTTAGGIKTPLWADVVLDSPFRLGGANAGSAQTRTVTIGGSEVQVAVRVGNFPAGTTRIPDGAVVEITGGENAGDFYEVVEGIWQDQATAYRVPLVQTQAPEGWPAESSSESSSSSSSSSSS